MSAPLSPVTLEVVRNGLYAIAEEMSVIVMRSARSPLLKEAGDLSSASRMRKDGSSPRDVTFPFTWA